MTYGLVHLRICVLGIFLAWIWSSKAFNSFVVSLSTRDIHLPTVTRQKGLAYHKDLSIQSLELNLFLKVLSVDLVMSQRASFAADCLVRSLTWSTASISFARAVDR